MFNVKRILHPTDFSAYSKKAFHVACALARDYGAQLIVLHVTPRPDTAVLTTAAAMLVEAPNRVHEATLARLRQVRTADAGVRIEHRLEEGDAAASIVDVAAELQTDLIVMGTHGRTGLLRLLMGSVAESVLRNAACPVLTIKSPEAESAESTDPDFSKSQDQYIPLAF